MKWRRNIGVMPCDPEDEIEVRYANGTQVRDLACLLHWGFDNGEYNIVAYVLPETVWPDYDYNESQTTI